MRIQEKIKNRDKETPRERKITRSNRGRQRERETDKDGENQRRRETQRSRDGQEPQTRLAQMPPPHSAHASGRGRVRALHLLDGSQRVCVLLLRLLNLPQTAAPLVILCHLGLRMGRKGRCWGSRAAPRPGTGPGPVLRPLHTGMGTGSERMRSS